MKYLVEVDHENYLNLLMINDYFDSMIDHVRLIVERLIYKIRVFFFFHLEKIELIFTAWSLMLIHLRHVRQDDRD
jgi:hypothetical protein